MTDTGRHANHHGNAVLFADAVRFFGHVDAFLGVRRFKHGDFSEFSIVAVVLFILGRMHARIVSRYEGKTAVHA